MQLEKFLTDMMRQRGTWWRKDLIHACKDAGNAWSPSVSGQAIDDMVQCGQWISTYCSDVKDYLLSPSV